MATLKNLAQPNADDFYAQYGPLAAPLREALGFQGQNDIDMLSQSRVDPMGGSDSGQSAYMKPSAALQAMLDAGQVSYGNMQNHDPSAQDGMGYWVNWDKMPKTAFGSGGTTGLSAYDPSLDKIMLNHHAVSKDPNFGYITPTQNLNVNQPGFWETFYNVAPSLFTMGMGAMAAPVAGLGMAGNIANQVPRLAQTIGNGGNPTSGLLGMLGQYFGVPSWATGAAGAAYGLSQGKKPSPVGIGTSLAQMGVNAVGPGG